MGSSCSRGDCVKRIEGLLRPAGGVARARGRDAARRLDLLASTMVRLSSIKWGVRYRLSILGGVTYVLVVARTGTPTVPTALGVPYGYAPAVTRVLGPTIAMSVTILKL